MTFDRLANTSFSAVKLHGTLDFESSRVGVASDTDKDEPFVIGSCAIVDDLGPSKGSVTVEDFLRWGCSILDRPVEDGRLGN